MCDALVERFTVVGNASKICSHIFRIFDSDGNDYLDFKEYLMAIDIANRDTGQRSDTPQNVMVTFFM